MCLYSTIIEHNSELCRHNKDTVRFDVIPNKLFVFVCRAWESKVGGCFESRARIQISAMQFQHLYQQHSCGQYGDPI